MGPQIPESEELGAQGLDSYIPRNPQTPGSEGKGNWELGLLSLGEQGLGCGFLGLKGGRDLRWRSWALEEGAQGPGACV